MKRSEILLSVASALLVIKLIVAYSLDVNNIYKGEYKYQYETDDIYEEHEGKINENGEQVVNGTYSYFVDDAQYTVEYYADKTGYHPIFTAKIPNPDDAQVGLPPRAVGSLLGR